MELLGKYILFDYRYFCDYNKHNIVVRKLRRINRETKSQYISDVQRVPYHKDNKETGKRTFDWNFYIPFQIIARRFRKNKLINKDGTFSDYYGTTSLVSKDDMSSAFADKSFDELFQVVDCHPDRLFDYEISRLMSGPIKKTFNKLLGKEKTTPPYVVCLDDVSDIGKHLNEAFGVPVYYVDRMWDVKTHEHWSFDNKEDCDYDRNLNFHQVTCFGGDEAKITKEENTKNYPTGIWFFEGKIVYVKMGGCSEH